MKGMRLFLLITGLVAGSILSSTASAVTHDIYADFSSSANPNGVWQYGWLNALGGTFTPFTAVEFSGSAWYSPTLGFIPLAGHDTVSGWASFHPGGPNQYGDFRFTAPSTGSYALNFQFEGGDPHGTTTDVHINIGGINLFSAFVNGYLAPSLQSYANGAVFLNSGQTIDIAVGYGSNFNNLFDTSLVQGTITDPVPEPETYAMLLAGLGLLGFVARRKSQHAA